MYIRLWIKNYKELLKILVSKCKDLKDIDIDPKVFEIIEN